MKQKHIINLYILKEVIPNYFVGLGFLTVVILVGHLFYVIKLSVEKGISYTKAFALLILYLPLILQITLPVAVIVGTLLAIGRLSDDSEITAMRACGISLLKIFLPVVLFGLFISGFSIVFYEYIYPPGIKAYVRSKIEIYQANPSAELSKNLSYNTIDGVTITVDAVNPKTNELKNVRINYRSDDKIIFARRGLLLGKDHEYNVFPLILFNATSHPQNTTSDKKRDLFDEQFSVEQTIYIPDKEYSSSLIGGNLLWSLSEFTESIQSNKAYYAISNIKRINKLALLKIQYLEKDNEYNKFVQNTTKPKDKEDTKQYNKLLFQYRKERKKVEIKIKRNTSAITMNIKDSASKESIEYEKFLLHRKFSFAAVACAFAILGGPLGIFSKRAGKPLGLGISIVIIILFFVMVFLGEFLAKQGYMPYIIAGWLPSIILYPIGGILFTIKLSGRDSVKDVLIELCIKIKKIVSNKKKLKIS